jgi:hypothetical protein
MGLFGVPTLKKRARLMLLVQAHNILEVGVEVEDLKGK